MPYRKVKRRLYAVSLALFLCAMLFSHPDSGPEAGLPALATQIIDPNAKVVYEVEKSLLTGQRIRNVERYKEQEERLAIPYQSQNRATGH